MSEWSTVALRDLCDAVQYGVNAPKSENDLNAPMLLRITDIVPPRIDWENVPRCDISEEKLAKYVLHDGDIVVARSGSVGYAKRVKRPPAQTVFASYLVRFIVSKGVDAGYVGHIVESKAYREWVLGHAGGAAQPNANARILGNYPVPVPGEQTQRRIAAVLSAFDDLIEINERRIERLEDLARSLYREWFVQFRFPGHEDMALVDSQLGLIPEGWEVARLAELVTTQYGFTASATPENVGPKLLRGMDINKRSFVDWSRVPHCAIGDQDLDRFSLGVGDVCVIRMADPGKVGIVEAPVEAVFASYLVRLRSTESRVPPYFLFHLLDSSEYQDWIIRSSTGATRKSASAKVLTEPQIVVPSVDVASAFERVVGELRQQLTTLVEESAALAATRDLLLPRLVTGDLDISDLDLGILNPTEAE